MAGDARLSNNEMITLHEMNFDEIFPMFAEEDARLKGGPYQKGYIPIEDMLTVTPDMEGIIDERRVPAPAEESKKPERGKWYYFRPKPQDLRPFHAIMAMSENDDLGHPSFSSPFLGKGRVKITYHRGGKTVRQKKEVSP
ncbi:MAG: hypothetical protein AAB630_01455 [Patescibacteria group bacterium]